MSKAGSALAVAVGLILLGAGSVAVATAHRAQAIQVQGTLSLYQRQTCPGGKSSGYTIVLARDSHAYGTCRAHFPALLLPVQVERGTPVVLWIDQGSTDVLGLRLGAAEGNAPTYASVYLTHPEQLGNDQRWFGALGIVFGGLALAMGVGLMRRESPSGAPGTRMGYTGL